MKKELFGWITLVLICNTHAQKGYADDPFRSDSGIFGPSYSDILKKIDHLHTEFPELTHVIEYGRSVRGRPLKILLVGHPNRGSTHPALVMSGSTHGNEYLHIEDRLPEEMVRRYQTPGPIQSFIDRGGVFVLIPLLNPDGYEARERENANGVDLNRDWDVPPAGFSGFKEPETSTLKKQLEVMSLSDLSLTYQVTVDYHCCIGALLHPWSYTQTPLPQSDLDKHSGIGELVKQNLGVPFGTTGDILGYYPLGTSKDYYYHRYRALSFTYEGRYREEDKYLEKHLAWWEAIVQWLNWEAQIETLKLSVPHSL